MPTHVIAAVAAIALSLLLLSLSLLSGPSEERRRARVNMSRGLGAELAPQVGEGVLEREASGGLAALARRLLPVGATRRLDRQLAKAGRPPEWPLDRLLAVKLVLPVVAGALGLLYLRAAPSTLSVLVTVVAVAVMFFLPELLLHSKAEERSKQIGLELADTLDQMTIAVEAGLGFDQAMQRAGRNGKGPLAQELLRTLQDVAVGRSRQDAYTDLAERTGAPDLRRFIRAVIQADKYGVAVADTLRTQASEMRLKRRQRAEEKAMQIPVKVIFPLMFFILPVLFIVLMGPAAMDIAASFSG
jgi:tight adherence protein C